MLLRIIHEYQKVKTKYMDDLTLLWYIENENEDISSTQDDKVLDWITGLRTWSSGMTGRRKKQTYKVKLQ